MPGTTLARARAFHAVTFLVAAGAVLLQLILVFQGQQHLGDTEPAIEAVAAPDLATRLVRFFSYLTIWFNLLVAGTSLLLAIAPDRMGGRVFRALRLDALVIAVGGGAVHFVFLRPLLHLDGGALVADKLLHIVVPALCLIGWLWFGPRGLASGADVRAFLVVPLCWLGYTLVRGAAVDWYPYPFIDVNEHGYAAVTLNCLAIALLMLAIALGASWLDRRLGARSDSSVRPQ